MTDLNEKIKPATSYTIEKNREAARALQIDLQNPDNEECRLAKSHCLKPFHELILKNGQGEEIFQHEDYDYAREVAVPESVNPSLWLNVKGLYETGIFSVVEKDIVQVRGFDIANLAFIRGKSGWIVLDSGSTVEGAAAAVRETEKVLEEEIRPNIRAVIISHSHGDHFGGICGIISPEQVGRPEDGKIPIYVPGGFDEATMNEYIYAGGAMKRRGAYQMGSGLMTGALGKVSVGCGLDTVSGTGSYIIPTNYIEQDTTEVIDGITVDFQITNETEAVANMQNYFHEYRALWVADNCIGTLHNIYTMRGAKIRDAKLWAQNLYETYCRYGDKAQVIFQGHAWPHWNTQEDPDAVKRVLLNHAAAYQFTHDNSLHYIAQGATANEVAHKIKLPEETADTWYLRPYYGTHETNARAIYHKYLGFYDGNPVHLNPLTEVEEARKFVEYVGSEEAVLEKARKDFENGNYQYAAQAANYVVFVNPKNWQARYLCADALEQLGYQAESAIWRNGYLKGAQELRQKKQDKGTLGGVMPVLAASGNEQILDYLGMAIDGNKMASIVSPRAFCLQIIKVLSESEQEEKETDYFGEAAKVQEEYLVQFYGGALLKRKLMSEKEERFLSAKISRDPVVKVTRQGLLAFAAGEKDAWKQFDTEHDNFWEQLAEAVIDLDQCYDFNIIEP